MRPLRPEHHCSPGPSLAGRRAGEPGDGKQHSNVGNGAEDFSRGWKQHTRPESCWDAGRAVSGQGMETVASTREQDGERARGHRVVGVDVVDDTKLHSAKPVSYKWSNLGL